ncbi:MAG: MucR family transcriptional regulator [Geminicoccaceae bacterium]
MDQRSGDGRGGSRPARRSRRRLLDAARRREVLPGYPVLPRAMSIEEVDAYLDSDPIPCLLCGHSFKVLARHLQHIHAMTPDQYRERYGLPYSIGLAAVSSRQRFEELLRQRVARATPRKGRKKSKPVVHKPLEFRGKERHSHYQRLMATRRLNEVNKLPADFRFGPEHLETFVNRVLTGRTFKEVARDPDMPSLAWVRTAFMEWPRIRERFERGVEALPFPLQAKLKRLGPRFTAAVARLRARDMSIMAIAKVLGVDAMSVHARLPKAEPPPPPQPAPDPPLGSKRKRR